jgi:hypothetical protein
MAAPPGGSGAPPATALADNPAKKARAATQIAAGLGRRAGKWVLTVTADYLLLASQLDDG